MGIGNNQLHLAGERTLEAILRGQGGTDSISGPHGSPYPVRIGRRIRDALLLRA